MTSTTTRLPNLLKAGNLGGISIANRVVLAPLTRGRSGPSRVPNSSMAEYYRSRSSAGLLITEATSISEQGNGWVDAPGIYNDDQESGWRSVVEAAHLGGSKIVLQLWHTGRASHSSFQVDNVLPVSASALKIEGSQCHTPLGKRDYEVPRALDEAEIPGVVADYARAAERAKRAGFDGVEIHAANGYLIDQFLQSVSNKREDGYGGSIEKRYRFLSEIVAAVTSVFDRESVGVRLSPNGAFNAMGSGDFREQFTYTLERLAEARIGYVHVMDGLSFGFHEKGDPFTLEEARRVYPGSLIGNVGYDAESAEERIAQGSADAIAFGRPYLANPDLVERFANGWPLADIPPVETWYFPGEKGYNDHPRYKE